MVFTDNPLGNCDESDRPPISESSGNKYWQNLPSLWFSSNHHHQEQRHHQIGNAMFPHQGNCASSSPEQGASRASKECIIISLHHSTALSPSNALLRIFAPSRGFAAHCMVKFCRKQHSGLHQLQHSASLCSTLVYTNANCSCSAHTCHCARDSEGWTLEVFLRRKMNPHPFAEQSEGGDKWNQTSNLILAEKNEKQRTVSSSQERPENKTKLAEKIKYVSD